MVTMYLVRNGCLDFVSSRSFARSLPLLQAYPEAHVPCARGGWLQTRAAEGGDSSRRSGRAAAADPGHARRLWEQEQQEQQKQQEQQEQQERLGGGDGVGVGCAWGRSNLATAGSTEEQMAEGRGGIDANGGRGLGSAEGAPLPLNQGDFFAFTPVFGRFRRFFGAGQRIRRETRRGAGAGL